MVIMSCFDDLTVQEHILELCKNVITLDTNPNDVFNELIELKKSSPILPSLLLDILVSLEGDVQLSERKDEALTQFRSLLDLISDQIIPGELLRIELEILEAGSAVNKQQLVRLKTRLYFKQSKFNLLREESEGYAKLITELLDGGDTVSSKAMMTRVLCLIGQFNLDPNRVTDIVLECFECSPSGKQFFISLLREIKANREYLCTLLGFKYTFYQELNRETPFSLYVVTASLIQEDMIDLMKITAFMVPKSEGIKESHRTRATTASNRAKKAETIMASNIPVDCSRSNSSNMESHANENSPSIVGVSFATVAGIQDAEDAKLAENLSEGSALALNQKLGLVCALVEEGAWSLAKQLIDRLPEYYAVQASPRVSNAIADLIDNAIDGFYREKCSQRLEGLGGPPEEKKGSLDRVTCWTDMIYLASVLWYIGPRLAYRSKTTTKLLRLITVFYQETINAETCPDHLSNTMMDIIDEVILPGLSLSESNTGLSEEVWTLLQMFPYSWRYRLYGRWKTMNTIRHPEVSIVRGKVLGRTKYVLKRLSKETVKVMGRQLGKLCHIHPITVFDYLLSQVQTFDSLIQPVVESLRFLTSLEFDILSYCIIEQLANPEKQQLKASDGTLSPWLQSLGTLVGAIYKKYNVELCGMLNYVVNQLKNEKSFDLLVLREIIQNMSSIESVAGATQDQLEALSGGELLKQEAGGFSNARNKRASSRLRDALLSGDMAVGLCILIAQQRECVVHNDSKLLPLKLVGEMLDQCRDTLLQFGSFLLSHIRPDDYARRIPSASILMSEYHLRLDSAMYLTRPTYMPKVQSAYESAKRAVKSLDCEHKQKLDSKQKFVFFKSALDTIVNQLIDELTPCMPTHVCSDIPMRLLVVFWILSLYDIDVPSAAYERTIESIRKQTKENSERIDMSKSKRMKEEERLRSIEAKLKEEQKRQSDHVERIRLWLAHSKDRLFEAGRSQQTGSFLQMCIIPRALFSESDAIYCARLVIILHQQRTTLFQSLIFIDKTFSDVLPLICGLSENEANSFGRFLQIILSQAQRWHADKNIFEKECEGFPGLITKMRSGGAVEDSGDNVSFENFRKLCYKWQAKLNKAFLSVLSQENNDYVMVRNCLVIMTKLIPCFPLLREFYESLEQVVAKVRDGEKGSRDDLSLKAASYAGRLKIRGLPLFEAHQFCHRPTAAKVGKANGDALDRKRIPQAISPSGTKRKVKSEKILEKTIRADKEKREKTDKEEKGDIVEKEDKILEPEEGEVPPSPPSKKIRAYSTDERSNRTNGISKDKDEKDKKEKPKKEAKRELERDSIGRDGKEKDDRRRKEISLDHDVAGPMPPPSKKDDRTQERKRETKGHKRQARDSDENGEAKVARKERETMDARLSRPSPVLEKRDASREKEREKKEKRQRDNKPNRK